MLKVDYKIIQTVLHIKEKVLVKFQEKMISYRKIKNSQKG
jgi:hypothetical protein